VLEGCEILEPQATLVTVVDELWQQAVESVLNEVRYAIIDVSCATENLLWEIETVLRSRRSGVLLIAESEAVRAWMADAAAEPLRSRLAELLASADVFEYRGDRWRDRRRFRQNLMRAIDNRDGAELSFLEPLTQRLSPNSRRPA
jgi:hypothetical protein